jgi:HlyD family secretion protein
MKEDHEKENFAHHQGALGGGLLGASLWYFFLRQGEVGQERLTLFGNVDIRQVELAFNGSERIAAIRVEEGASVNKGQVLAVLETRRLHQLVTMAEAQVAG